jgi:polar amino acid transport system substrate-binding protein
VLGSSDFRTVGDLDRPGVRVVAGEANTTTFRSVARALKSASVVAVPSVGEAIAMLRDGRVDAFALGIRRVFDQEGLQSTAVAPDE